MQHKWAIFKTGNGESGNGEWERGMGTGNGNLQGMTGESAGNGRGICGNPRHSISTATRTTTQYTIKNCTWR